MICREFYRTAPNSWSIRIWYVTNAQLPTLVTIVQGEMYVKAESEPSPYVTVGLDVLGAAATVSGHDNVAKAIAVGNGSYDPSPVNLAINGGLLAPGVLGEAFGPIGLIYDAGSLGGGVVTNNIMAPMLEAIPGNTMNANDVSIQTPEARCVDSNMC
jgi:hypothetical protein